MAKQTCEWGVHLANGYYDTDTKTQIPAFALDFYFTFPDRTYYVFDPQSVVRANYQALFQKASQYAAIVESLGGRRKRIQAARNALDESWSGQGALTVGMRLSETEESLARGIEVLENAAGQLECLAKSLEDIQSRYEIVSIGGRQLVTWQWT